MYDLRKVLGHNADRRFSTGHGINKCGVIPGIVDRLRKVRAMLPTSIPLTVGRMFDLCSRLRSSPFAVTGTR